MKLRYKRKQFWWTWRGDEFDRGYQYFGWNVGRIKHQRKD